MSLGELSVISMRAKCTLTPYGTTFGCQFSTTVLTLGTMTRAGRLSALTTSAYRRLDAAGNPEEVMVRAVFANDHQTYRRARCLYRQCNGAAVEEIDHRRIAQQ